MASDAWFGLDGVEIVNMGRTVRLAQTLGITNVRTRESSVSWIEGTLESEGFGLGPFGLGGFGVGPLDYGDITTAPWYDADAPESADFIGVVPLEVTGLDDSSLESSVTEYLTNGGNTGKPRNSTQTLVWSVVIVAATEKGAEFGKRWLDRTLRGRPGPGLCSGADLFYFKYGELNAPAVHRRDVALTRGTNVTRKRKGKCSSLWWLTFTLTAGDPFEYGEPVRQVTSLGGSLPIGVGDEYGSLILTQESCPVYDYSPIYDPLYPALVASPTAPDFYPEGWNIEDGMTFFRRWVEMPALEPSALNVVPFIQLTTETAARRVRVSIWPKDTTDPSDQCGPLFTVIVNYLPADTTFYVDGEQEACYVWDGFSPVVRRTDSLVYGTDAQPVQWTAFNDPEGYRMTLDTFADDSGYEGDGDIRVAVDLIPKTD